MARKQPVNNSPNKGGRPKGSRNKRSVLIRAGLDRAISDRMFWTAVKKRIEAGDTQMLIQVGKWKGLTERTEIEHLLPADGIFRAETE